MIYTLFLILTLCLMLLSFPVGVYTVFYTKISNTSLTYASPVTNIGLVVGLYTISLPVTTSLGSVFVASLAIYSGMFLLAGTQKLNLFSAIRSAWTRAPSELFRNPLVSTVVALGSMTLAIAILDLIQTNSGIPTGSLRGDPLLLFVSITLAPLREELGFRVALIGVLALVLGLRSSIGTAIKAVWRPSLVLASDPGNSLNRLGLGGMLIFSSALFGLAHYTSGAGWGIGKVSEATLAGMVLGYLYIRYGFHTAVLLHWGVNYFGTAYAFFGQGVWGIPWFSDTGNPLDYLVQFDLFVLIGATSLFFLGYKLLKRLMMGSGATEVGSGWGVNPEGAGPKVQGHQPNLERELRRGRLRSDGEGGPDTQLPGA